MSKINLLASESDLNSFCSTWFSDALSEHFNLIYNEHNHSHSPTDTVCVTNFLNTDATWYKQYTNRGYKLIVDHFWDSDITETSVITDKLTIRNKNWLWYNESLWYRHLGYHNYTPNKNYTNTFLMLMHLKKKHRDQIVLALCDVLDRAIYSYVERGVVLSEDIDYAHGNWQRHFNPVWYNATKFSVVVETTINSPTWISEKIFKPIAFQHPFVVWGSAGTLTYLREQGFQTFGHVIDESYDNINNANDRLDKIVNEIKRLVSNIDFNDKLSQEILLYNRERFFDQSLVQEKINNEIVKEILDFIE